MNDDDELTEEGAAKLAEMVNRPGRKIPALAALLSGRPTKDHMVSALEARVVALEAELEATKRERDLAVAHDRQPYPTAEAYEKVVLTLATERDPPSVTLADLRRSALLTQADLAKQFGVSVPAMSHCESRANHRTSTLRRFVEAIGGELMIRVRVGGKTYRLRER